MSARRPQSDCPFCDPSVAERVQTHVWRTYQSSRSWQKASAKARRLGVERSEPALLRRHYQYHRPTQVAASSRRTPEEQLERFDRLPARLREIVSLSGRVPGLTANEYAQLYYWTGRESQWHSARNACYRDLRRLVLDDVLCRWSPDPSRMPRGAPRAFTNYSFYFPGREAVAALERESGLTLSRGRDWFLSPADIQNEKRVMRTLSAHWLVTSLWARARELDAARSPLVVRGSRCRLRFQPCSWYSTHRLRLPVDPKGAIEGGFAAFDFLFPERSLALPAPFLYELDDAGKPAEWVAERLLSYREMKRERSLTRMIEQLAPASALPPLLLVVKTPRRLVALRQAAQKLAREQVARDDLPLVALCDEETFHESGLTDSVWVGLWDTVDPPRRFELAAVLLAPAREWLEAGVTVGARFRLAPPVSVD